MFHSWSEAPYHWLEQVAEPHVKVGGKFKPTLYLGRERRGDSSQIGLIPTTVIMAHFSQLLY